MDKIMCPFAKSECNTVRCQLWDVDQTRCVFASIADNLGKLNKIVDDVIDKMIYKY